MFQKVGSLFLCSGDAACCTHGCFLSMQSQGIVGLWYLVCPGSFGATLAFGSFFGLTCFSNPRHKLFSLKVLRATCKDGDARFLIYSHVSIRQTVRELLCARRLHQRHSDEKDRQDLGPRGGTVLCPAASQKWFGGHYNAEASFFSEWLHSVFLSQHSDLEKYPCIWS